MKKSPSAILTKYLGLYQKNPRGKVFAPLAESYRKLGMIDDAMKILREGIKYHPTYTLGYLVLAQCYYDQGKLEQTYQTLLPFVRDNLENVVLQKLFAIVCLELGHHEEALETFKYLLFISPRDAYYIQQVKLLEDDLLFKQDEKRQSKIVKQPDEFVNFQTNEDDWVQVDFGSQLQQLDPIQDINQWEMKSLTLEEIPVSAPVEVKFNQDNVQVLDRSLDDDFYTDEFEGVEEDDEATNNPSASQEEEATLVSHTLVDLYIAQNYNDRAIELLEKFVELNPKDTRSLERLEELRSKSNEESDHLRLLNLVENRVKTRDGGDKLEKIYQDFMKEIKLVSNSKKLIYG